MFDMYCTQYNYFHAHNIITIMHMIISLFQCPLVKGTYIDIMTELATACNSTSSYKWSIISLII